MRRKTRLFLPLILLFVAFTLIACSELEPFTVQTRPQIFLPEPSIADDPVIPSVDADPVLPDPQDTTYDPPVTEAPVNQNLIPTFDSTPQRKINVFLSNFAEQPLLDYPCQEYDLLSFAYLYCRINNHSAVYISDDSLYYCVNQNTVDEVLISFFGHTVTPGSSYQEYEHPAYPHPNSNIIYDNGVYKHILADGAIFNHMAVAHNMVLNADNTYSVDFNVYWINDVDNLDPYYNMTPQQIENCPEADYISTGHATLALVGDSYQIIYYHDNRTY